MPSLGVAAVVLAVTVALFFLVRTLAPSEMLDKDQERPAAYLLDVVVNGNFFVQRDDTGDIASKPPLYTWLTAATAVVIGGANEMALFIPTGLSVLGMALLILLAGDKYYNRRVGITAAAMFLLSMVAWKQVQLARTDPLYSLLVFAGVLVLYQVVHNKLSWVVFWLMAALITLTKGPLGVILAAGGLLAFVWDRRRLDTPSGGIQWRWSEQTVGILAFVVICGGWFLLGYIQMGQPLIDKMIGRELVGHAIASDDGKRPGEGLFFPTAYYLSRFPPWALLAVLGLITIIRKPDADPGRRFLDRYLAAHFLLGMAIFSIAPHQRPDHLFPLIPASILIGARELERWWRVPLDRRGLGLYSLAVAVFLAVQIAYITFYKTGELKIQRMAEIEKMVSRLQSGVGADFPLVHVDAPYALQFRLGTMTQQVPMQWVVDALQSEYAVFAVIRRPSELFRMIPDDFQPRFHEQLTAKGEPFLWIVSNREAFERHDEMVHFVNGLKMETRGMEYRLSPDSAPHYIRRREGGSIRLSNLTNQRRKLTLMVETAGVTEGHPVVLLAGQSVEYYF